MHDIIEVLEGVGLALVPKAVLLIICDSREVSCVREIAKLRDEWWLLQMQISAEDGP